jgi:hypothetical protein
MGGADFKATWNGLFRTRLGNGKIREISTFPATVKGKKSLYIYTNQRRLTSFNTLQVYCKATCKYTWCTRFTGIFMYCTIHNS